MSRKRGGNAIRDSVLWWNATKCNTGKHLGHFLDLLAAGRNKTPHFILEALGPHVRESETPSTDTLTSGGYVTAQVEGRRENEAHKDFGEPQMDHLPIGKQVENPCFRLCKDISILRHMEPFAATVGLGAAHIILTQTSPQNTPVCSTGKILMQSVHKIHVVFE